METPLNDFDPMPIGEYKGTRLIDVPASRLLYLHREGCDHPQLKAYIIDNLQALNLEIKKEKNNR